MLKYRKRKKLIKKRSKRFKINDIDENLLSKADIILLGLKKTKNPEYNKKLCEYKRLKLKLL